jgi:hypothetical protein
LPPDTIVYCSLCGRDLGRWEVLVTDATKLSPPASTLGPSSAASAGDEKEEGNDKAPNSRRNE